MYLQRERKNYREICHGQYGSVGITAVDAPEPGSGDHSVLGPVAEVLLELLNVQLGEQRDERDVSLRQAGEQLPDESLCFPRREEAVGDPEPIAGGKTDAFRDQRELRQLPVEEVCR